MTIYRVLFYKTVTNAAGVHEKHLQRQIDVPSDSASGALVWAQQQTDGRPVDADSIEVRELTDHVVADLKTG